MSHNTPTNTVKYPIHPANPNFPEIEKSVIEYWEKNSIFSASIKTPAGNSPQGEYVFYDGPPFANGLPHYGHLLCGYIKDIAGRYHTMLGKRVERRFGWDCHGLPAEMGVMKELGISGKVDIEKYGIDRFNQLCYDSVMNFSGEWEEYIMRQARWVNYREPYRTLDTGYMQSVIWAFKQLYDKGLIYQSERIMPYSWACETPVSDFETRMDNSYRKKESKSVILSFVLSHLSPALQKIIHREDIKGEIIEIRPMVWTTTPWTLPSNLGLAVGREIEYNLVFIRENPAQTICYIMATELPPETAKDYLKEIKYNPDRDHITTCNGEEIVGSRYIPIFNYFSSHENSFQIMAADFVTTTDGTGIVHIAPGFGEDDYNLCNSHGIKMVCPVDSQGKFTHPVDDLAGQHVFDTNDTIIKYLKEKSLWIKTEQYIHNYPHCWRTDTPLIYKAIPSWYLKVTDIKERMITHNQSINWVPEHIRDGLFGKWLENARDWSISRNRYWGCPIPVWISDDPQYPHIEVYGSIAEMEKAFNTKIDNLHRPFIDQLVKANPSDPTGKSMLRRVPEILDCWFESGAMPFAHVNYPFENKDWFEKNFPADLIVEYVGQTRGWFYTLIVLSTALFDKPPFLNCICHGVVLGDGGTKLSKRLKNYADPMIVFNTISSDALRWAMVSSNALRAQEIVVNKDADTVKEALRNVIKPLWSAYNFFSTYANIDQIQGEFDLNPQAILDRYIINRTMATVRRVKKSMDKYDLITACNDIEKLLDILNNWYIRRSREKFWGAEKTAKKIQAYNTIYTVLCLICRISAPLMPLISEAVYRNLHHHNQGISVHLEHFPDHPEFIVDESIIHNMEKVMEACSVALSIRNEQKIKVRQPLAAVTFIGVATGEFDQELQQLVLDEINVKKWINLDAEKIEYYAERKLALILPIIGQKMPEKTKELIQGVKNGNWQYNPENNEMVVSGIIIDKEMYQFQLLPKTEFHKVCRPLNSQDSLVMLDTAVDQELIDEGIARDLVRHIQQMRKESGLEVTNRITVEISLPSIPEIKIAISEVEEALNKWKDYVASQVLAEKIVILAGHDNNFETKLLKESTASNAEGGGYRSMLKIDKIEPNGIIIKIIKLI